MWLQFSQITGDNSVVFKKAKKQTFHLFTVQTQTATEVSQIVRTFQVTKLNRGLYSFEIFKFHDFLQFSRTFVDWV